MDHRRSDPRIYIVTFLFLSCIFSGGVLLGLYMFLSDPNPLFLQAGMVIVGVPWLFWFLAYIYSCILKPCTVSVNKSVANYDPEKADQNNNNKVANYDPEKATSDSNHVTTTVTTPREGEKHVQFGNVMVIGDEGGKEEEDRNEGSSNNLIQNLMRMEEQESGSRSNSRSDDDDDDDDDDDESSFNDDCDKTPLRLSVGNK